MNRPLKIYLDNSDFSDLSRADRTAENDAMIRELFSWKEKGVAEFFFSIAHVFESSAAAQDYLVQSRGRFGLIGELCGGNCFCDPYFLMKGELEAGGRYDRSLRRDGWWLPIERPFDIEIPTISEALNGALNDSGINRSQRRTIERALFDSKGRPTQQAQELLAGPSQEIVEHLSRKFPLGVDATQTVIDVFLGRRPRVELAKVVERSMAQLQLFHEWHVKRWEDMAPLFAWLSRQGKGFEELVNAERAKIEDFIRDGLRSEVSEEGIEAMARKAFERIKKTIAERFVSALGNGASCDSWASAPGLNVFINMITGNVRGSVLSVRNPRKPKSSDFGDALHSVYAPYVDIFRADAHAANELRSMAEMKQVVVVRALRDLPQVIQRVLEYEGHANFESASN